MPIPILMYHQIDVPPPRGTPLRGLVVSPASFRRQMQVLRLAGMRGLSMAQLLPYLRGEKQGRVVGITFDDGYRNNLEHALPVLRDVGFGATCYAVSGAVGGRNAWDAGIGVPDKALMNESELREWVAGGMEVGAHTRDHADLTKLAPEQARVQVTECRDRLEQLLGAPVRHFCYPYGRFDDTHAQMVADAGYETATTTRRGRARERDDLFRLKRVLVAHSTHLGYFGLKLWTGYEDRRG